MTRYESRSIALAVAAAGLAGYVDAVGYLSAGRFFVSFMSGNSTRFGIALGEGNLSGAGAMGSVIGLFVIGVLLGSVVSSRSGPRRKPFVLALVAGLLALAAVARAEGIGRGSTAFALLAMGAENAVFQRRGEVSVGLTYVTGTLVRLGHRLARALSGGPPWAWVPYALMWCGMVGGGALGAVAHRGTANLALWPAAVAAGLLALAALRVRVRFA